MEPKSRWMSWVIKETAADAPVLPWDRRVRHARRAANAAPHPVTI